jgi:hypothetical protein
MPERDNAWSYYPFIKWYPKNWLHGSIRFDCTPEERSVFVDLVNMANESRNRGTIQANYKTPYPHKYIAEQLNIKLKLLNRCLKKFEEQDRLHENEVGITITNFEYYQGLDTRKGRPRPGQVPPEQLPLEPTVTWTKPPDLNAVEQWIKALKYLEGETTKANYRTWLSKTIGLAYDGNKFVIGVPNNFVGEYLYKNQTSLIERALSELYQKEVAMELQLYKIEE